MNSIYIKNFMMTAILVVLSFFLLGLSFIFLGRAFLLNERRESAASSAAEISRAVAAYSEYGLTGWDLRLVITSVARSTNNHILICDAHGTIISASGMELVSPLIGANICRYVLTELRENGEVQMLTDLGGIYYDKPLFVVGLPVLVGSGREIAGFVFVGTDLGDMGRALSSTINMFILTSVVIMLIALIMSFYTSKRQAEPLNEMAAASRRFAKGDFTVRVDDKGRLDEIGALAVSFNTMAQSLEKSEQLRSEFVANVSHEMKTPMTTISGFADGILDGTIPKEDQDKYLQTISSETKRLSRLVRQMLQMSRMESTDTANLLSCSFNLSEIIMRTLLAFETRATERYLDVDAQIPEDGIIVNGDADSITQVVYNLLDNAMKFSNHGSTVGISLWKQDGKAFVSVKNHGETIPAAELPLIFDRFHKVDRSRSSDGIGLGLAIAKTILTNHGEDIAVTSRDGTTEFIFTVRLKQ